MRLRQTTTALIAILLLGLLTACGGGATTSDAGTGKVTVRLSLNPGIYGYLPVFVALDRGYFAAENIDLQLTKIQGSSATLLPQLARGDLDIVPIVAAPGLFNSFSEGFQAKLIANINGPKPGWGESGYLMVRQELWNSRPLGGPADLRGLKVDGGPAGSPLNLVAREAIRMAGLTAGGVTFTEKLASTGDQLAALQNGAVDVAAVTEVTASQLEAQRVAHRWLPASQVVPWAQDGFFAANSDFLAEHGDAVARFLRAYVHGARDVTEAGPQWTPELLQIAARATGLDPEIVRLSKAPAWVGSLGAIDTGYLERSQQIWADADLVKKPVPVPDMVDRAPLAKAGS